jgi:hypothetical protein
MTADKSHVLMTAVHEAGHIVAARSVGVRVLSASAGLESGWTEHDDCDPGREAFIAHCGPAAEARWEHLADDTFWTKPPVGFYLNAAIGRAAQDGGDWARIRELGYTGQDCMDWAQAFVRDNWEPIERTASALLDGTFRLDGAL